MDTSKKRKFSPVWDHFDQISVNKVRCRLCATVLSYNDNTSSMLRHHRARHHGKTDSDVGVPDCPSITSADDQGFRGGLENLDPTCVQPIREALESSGSRMKSDQSLDDHSESPLAETYEKKKRSSAWDYFDQISVNKVKCRVCPTVISYNDNTSSMLRHIRAKHDDRTARTDVSVQGVLITSQSNALSVKNGQSVTPNDDQGFRGVVDQLDSACVLPTGEKKRSSGAWDHFDQISINKVKCKICATVISFNNNTSSMLRHIRAKHDDRTARTDVSIQASKKQELAQASVEDCQSVTPNDNQGFRGVVDQLDPACILPTGETLETSGSHMESDQSLDDHSESNQLQQVDTPVKSLEGEKVELAETYEALETSGSRMESDQSLDDHSESNKLQPVETPVKSEEKKGELAETDETLETSGSRMESDQRLGDHSESNQLQKVETHLKSPEGEKGELAETFEALESSGSMDQSVDDHSESNQLCKQQVERQALLKSLERKRRELAKKYKVGCGLQPMHCFNKIQKMNKKRKFSSVWKHFHQISINKVKCRICARELSYNNTTSSMLRHYRARHYARKGMDTSAKRSGVWNNFDKISVNKVKCRLCARVLSYNRNTSSMLRHNRAKHDGRTVRADENVQASKNLELDQALVEICQPITTDDDQGGWVEITADYTAAVSGGSHMESDQLQQVELPLKSQEGGKGELAEINKARKFSPVRELFEQISVNEVKCQLCATVLSYNDNTSSMLRHYRAFHYPRAAVSFEASKSQELAQESVEVFQTIALDDDQGGWVEITTDYTVKKTRKFSPVWEHFDQISINKVKCLICGRVICYSDNTSSMLRHHRAFHSTRMYRSGERIQASRKQEQSQALVDIKTEDCQPTREALETSGSRIESDQSLGDHSESNQFGQQVETLLKSLEGKKRELVESYESFLKTAQTLRGDIKTIEQQISNLISKSGCDHAERSLRSSGNQEVTIIGLFAPHSTVFGRDDKIMDCTNTSMHTASTSETNRSNTSGSVNNTETQPQQLLLKMPAVRLEDCRHKLGPNGVVFLCNDKMPEEKDEDDNSGDEDEVLDYNLEADPDYKLEENDKSDENSEKCIKTSCGTKLNHHQLSSLPIEQQHPVSPLQEAPLRESKGDPTKGKPLKYPASPLQEGEEEEEDVEEDPESIPEKKTALQSSSNSTQVEVKDTTTKQWVSEPVNPAQRIYPHQCPICWRRLSTSGALHIHQRRHREDNIQTTQGANGRKLYKCDKCDRTFRRRYYLRIHQGVHLDERPYVCLWCKKTFVYPGSLHKHKKWDCQEKPSDQISAKGYPCTQCPRTFYYRSLLKHHEQVHHSEIMPSKCPLCIKTFKHPTYLQNHLKTHDGQKPYLCDHCGKSFLRSAQLKRHLLFHSDEKLYKCSVCDKRYHIQQSLSMHMLTHSEERPFKCRICDKGFRRLYCAQKHERVHTREKPYSCSLCGKVYGYPESLYVHKKRFHSALGR